MRSKVDKFYVYVCVCEQNNSNGMTFKIRCGYHPDLVMGRVIYDAKNVIVISQLSSIQNKNRK